VDGQETKPYDKLDDEQKRCCVDIAIGISIIAARCPAFSKNEFAAISAKWSRSAGLDDNLCRYALRDVTNELFDSEWEFHIIKQGIAFTTQFSKRKYGAGNGEGEGRILVP
jgi:hypothetical protein